MLLCTFLLLTLIPALIINKRKKMFNQEIRCNGDTSGSFKIFDNPLYVNVD